MGYASGWLIVVCSLCSARPAVLPPLQNAAVKDQLPDANPVQAVLDAYIQALGGRAALDRIKTREAEGTIESPHHPKAGKKLVAEARTFKTSWLAPNRGRLEIFDINEFTSFSGFNGELGWTESSIQPGHYEDLDGRGIGDTLRIADPLRFAHLNTFYPELSCEAPVSGSACAVLRANHQRGTFRFIFDPGTHLLTEIDDMAAGEAFPRRYVFENYRQIDGTLFPFSIREIIPLPNLDPKTVRVENLYRFKKVTHNVPIPAERFLPTPGWTSATRQDNEN